MRQARDFEDPSLPTHVCRLHKALYGIKQAPKVWFNKLKHYLVDQGLRACQSDTSLFVHIHSNSIIYLILYVNDVIITCNNATQIRRFIHGLNKVFTLKDLGQLNHFWVYKSLPPLLDLLCPNCPTLMIYFIEARCKIPHLLIPNLALHMMLNCFMIPHSSTK